jgi:hypothetical protein
MLVDFVSSHYWHACLITKQMQQPALSFESEGQAPLCANQADIAGGLVVALGQLTLVCVSKMLEALRPLHCYCWDLA